MEPYVFLSEQSPWPILCVHAEPPLPELAAGSSGQTRTADLHLVPSGHSLSFSSGLHPTQEAPHNIATG